MQTNINTQATNTLPQIAFDRGFYSMKEVCDLTGFSRTHIYRLEAVGRFPRRRKLGLAKIGFVRAEVHAWMENLPKPDLPSMDDF
ncbi:MAG: AlpA family phage regulatory protein [Hyphomicrobium zavarzinii]|uniref:helix-turn-helix transcriptional regulator n=1 Tax=Hyphomicrobium zavarzinii TaxID=48292 RepID=UPI001A5C6690|nr:AlpA family phage regulatory protein [Hyphomicrobium zavarzinii]MBL8845589.1 AlpA family phage regulatory protein [Hyphomicrobium zavarzinii]